MKTLLPGQKALVARLRRSFPTGRIPIRLWTRICNGTKSQSVSGKRSFKAQDLLTVRIADKYEDVGENGEPSGTLYRNGDDRDAIDDDEEADGSAIAKDNSASSPASQQEDVADEPIFSSPVNAGGRRRKAYEDSDEGGNVPGDESCLMDVAKEEKMAGNKREVATVPKKGKSVVRRDDMVTKTVQKYDIPHMEL